MSACSRGCCATQAEHYRSLKVASADRRQLTKVTTKRDSSVEVDVTEHWHDRQDVLVKPKTVSVKMTTQETD
jgi:hypothetical protein